MSDGIAHGEICNEIDIEDAKLDVDVTESGLSLKRRIFWELTFEKTELLRKTFADDALELTITDSYLSKL
jgi:hypothetical protein